MAHTSHKTRFSDASTFDEICENCGATDRRGDPRLGQICPYPNGRPSSVKEGAGHQLYLDKEAKIKALKDEITKTEDAYNAELNILQKRCTHIMPDGTSADDGGMLMGHCRLCSHCFG